MKKRFTKATAVCAIALAVGVSVVYATWDGDATTDLDVNGNAILEVGNLTLDNGVSDIEFGADGPGNSGSDSVFMYWGNDVIDLGIGNDVLAFNLGDDKIDFFKGDDDILFHFGDAVISFDPSDDDRVEFINSQMSSLDNMNTEDDVLEIVSDAVRIIGDTVIAEPASGTSARIEINPGGSGDVIITIGS